MYSWKKYLQIYLFQYKNQTAHHLQNLKTWWISSFLKSLTTYWFTYKIKKKKSYKIPNRTTDNKINCSWFLDLAVKQRSKSCWCYNKCSFNSAANTLAFIQMVKCFSFLQFVQTTLTAPAESVLCCLPLIEFDLQKKIGTFRFYTYLEKKNCLQHILQSDVYKKKNISCSCTRKYTTGTYKYMHKQKTDLL